MYEYIKILKKTNMRFYPIDESEIRSAEERMGFEFPKSLKQFYKEIGYGFLGGDGIFINRLMHLRISAIMSAVRIFMNILIDLFMVMMSLYFYTFQMKIF